MMPNVGVSDAVAPYVGQAPSAQGGGNVAIFLSLAGSQKLSWLERPSGQGCGVPALTAVIGSVPHHATEVEGQHVGLSPPLSEELPMVRDKPRHL